MNSDKIPVVIDRELADIVPGYLDRRREELAVLREAVADRDFAALRVMGHNLKGTGGGYGFEPISDFGKRLEQAGLTGDLSGASAAIDALGAYLERIEVTYA